MSAKATARIPLLEREQVGPEVLPLYDALLQQRGVVPNMFKALANIPALAQGVAAFLKPIVGDGALPGWYKELIAIRICILHRFEYGIKAHSLSAQQKGAKEDQITSLEDFESGPFSESEKLGFRFADRIHSSDEIDDNFYASVKALYNDLQMMELTAVAAAFEFFPRFIGALRIPVTPVPDSTPQSKLMTISLRR
jgi:alkylhydroperoxidase family enzyme